MRKADLHIHTTVSDGRLSASEIVAEAVKRELGIISITDHDSYEGYFEAVKAAELLDLEVVPGSEITSEFHERECHLLAYGFDVEDEGMVNLMKTQKFIRIGRAKKIIDKLNKLGFDVSYDEVRAEAGIKGVVARPHIAKVMIRKGYASNHREVFMRYLGNHAKAYHKCEYRSVKEIIDIIHNAGGVTILAHPGNNYSDKELREFIDYGIDGFEYIHPSHNYNLQRKYEQLTRENGLIKSGGSDFHGTKFDDHFNFGVVAINIQVARHVMASCNRNNRIVS